MTCRLYTIVAELTYRCPLRCLYCSNPIDFVQARTELSSHQWCRVFRESAALGALQLHLSGGEPTLRPDLPELIRSARETDLYSNLITAGTLLDERKLDKFRECGLDHIQLSLQDSNRGAAETVAGVRCFDKKISVARLIRAAGFPLTLNVVLHRYNIDRTSELIELALDLGANRLEFASTQYYGWAMENRDTLMPTLEQNDCAEEAVRAAREKHRRKLEIAFVRADYFADRPKACMGGWANSYLCITPTGKVLPCHAASVIPELKFDNVCDRPLKEIWHDSPALNAFRGDDWMREPCRSCPNKKIDFGGCRCQAMMLTGDARAADPVCDQSPHHRTVVDALKGSELRKGEMIYRDVANSKLLTVQR